MTTVFKGGKNDNTGRSPSADGPGDAAARDRADATPPSAVGAGRYRWAVVLGQYTLAIVLTLLLVTKLLFLWRGDPRIPLNYSRDALLCQAGCKTFVNHGWYAHNPDLGVPEGQFPQDFPHADMLNCLIIKCLALCTHDTALIVNLLCLSSYVLTTLTALVVLRHFGIAYPPALACALLYSLLPYHFAHLDLGHYFLGCYQIVPLSILLALWLYLGRVSWSFRQKIDPAAGEDGGSDIVRWLAALAICLLQASAGIYYAFFAEYFLIVAGASASLQRRSLRPLAATAILVTVTLAGVVGNLAPSLLYWKQNGTNPAMIARPVRDAEIYAFKLTATMLPIIGHRVPPLERLRQTYEEQTVTANESSWTAQGLVANVGLLVLLGLLMVRKSASRLLEGLSALNIFGILLATTGGLGVLFSLLVASPIRSQNRISVFLSFFALASVAVLLDRAWERMAIARHRPHLANAFLIALVVAALWEQHPQQCRPDFPGVKRQWTFDAQFVTQIESGLPAGAMVFQLPYVQYPESAPIQQLDSYDNLRFYLHSNRLRWSGGAMKGRAGDRWQQQVAALPAADQLQTLSAAGFQGIQVSRRGYADQGQEIERQLRALLGVEPIVSASNQDSYFPLPPRSGTPELREGGAELEARSASNTSPSPQR